MKKLISEVWFRIKAETPDFFVRLGFFGLSLASVGASLQVIPNAPERIIDLGINLVVAGGIMAAVAKLTIKSPDQK